MSDSEFSLTPPELVEAKVTSQKLLPAKSRKIYQTAYSRLMEWKMKKTCSSFSETVLLAYFSELAQQQKPSTVWSNYSMIKRACRICEISQVTLDDIEDSGTLLIGKLKQTKNDVNRRFVVTEEYIKFYRMYIALRPAAAKDRRLFYAYRNGIYINQVVGKISFIRYLKQ
ncbi:hypothetical protein NQ318_017757 [Aromia moschata]|uniref:Uncharacterized protein n=1 Tax=Aromia moschata TaxID=1265417 RepID=A0AAV8XXH9_9CUCU|nr:hypothetical protein NQ318_017757 [Aromia moschata]